ncbi:MAG: recombination regulator RecX, partial [Candidatus Saccharimonadales bacterium]
MKITSIQSQIKRTNRYSIYVDGKYSFSLSEPALIEQGLAKNQELTETQIRELKKLQEEDKLYAQTLRYISYRARSEWEIVQYLKRKSASPSLIDETLNKL